MRENQRTAVAIACVALSALFLSLAIDSVGQVPSLTEFKPPDIPNIPQPQMPEKTDIREKLDPNVESIPDLQILGETGTNYLRTIVYGEYMEGIWEALPADSSPYLGSPLFSPNAGGELTTFTIDPTNPLEGYLPAAPNTMMLKHDQPLEYFDSEGLFYSSDGSDEPYNITYFQMSFSFDLLNSSELLYFDEYSEVPPEIEEFLQEMAEEITLNATSPYEQLLALEEYLSYTYEYDLNFTDIPEGVDPCEWFLVNSTEGVCIHFNTALTLMARTLNITARLVGGYYIDADATFQDVYPIQSHAFTEVPFEGLGWIIFDATPSADLNQLYNFSDSIIEEIEQVLCNKTLCDFELPDTLLEDALSETLFIMMGTPETSYLRTGVAEYYNGSWYRTIVENQTYSGNYINHNATDPAKTGYLNVFIQPVTNITGYLPVILYSNQVEAQNNLNYFPEHFIFYSAEPITESYLVSYTLNRFNETTLSDAVLSENPYYLQVPPGLESMLFSIATIVTQDISSPYLKLRALETYLYTNYNYSTPEPVPNYMNRVEWFLNYDQKGLCTDFNTALVLLARSIGIPSRLVSGYYVNPYQDMQSVKSSQTHAYVEALFDDLGWITFDATSPPIIVLPENGYIPTTTQILFQDSSVLKGSNFNVIGEVYDNHSQSVSGLQVLVYLKQYKEKAGVLCGEGMVENGVFNVTSEIPLNLPPGVYMVDVHTIGDDTYIGSWSDPPLSVLTETSFKLNVPEKVLVGKDFDVQGILQEKLSENPLSGTRFTVDAGEGLVPHYTLGDGYFHFKHSFTLPGNHTLNFSWLGSAFYLGAVQKSIIEALSLKISPENGSLIRGESSFILGRVHAEDIPGEFEGLTITVEEESISTVSDHDGVFTYIHQTSPYHPLGEVPVSFTLQSNSFSIEKHFMVQARPKLRYSYPEHIWGNQVHEIPVVLVDDLGNPIPDSEIKATYIAGDQKHDVTVITDDSGKTMVEVNLKGYDSGEVILEISYLGTSQYLTTKTSGQLHVISPTKSPYTLYLLGAGGLIGIAAILYYQNTKQHSKTNKTQSIPQELTRPNTNHHGLAVIFPQIEPPLPNVWGIDEPVEVEVQFIDESGLSRIGANVVLSYADSIPETFIIQGGSMDRRTLIFSKPRIIVFTAQSLNPQSEIKESLRIVDYRIEIIRLYNLQFKEAKDQYKDVKENYTARELLNYLKTLHTPEVHFHLEKMTHVFEEADYSLHPINRSDYVNFYLAWHEYKETLGLGGTS
jgi:transglutaminase-like putative cysteine protease